MLIKFQKYISLILLYLVSSTNIYSDNHKNWTILTYIAGDSDLNKFIDDDLLQMQQGANNNTNVLAFVNKKINEVKIAQKLVITNDNITNDGPDLINLDSGTKESVMIAINWAIENYPSDKFALILWDHGSGPLNKILQSFDISITDNIDININDEKGICYDYTTGNFLNDRDLAYICKQTKEKINKNIDIVAFDACLMANIEIAYAIKDSACYLVSSQESVPTSGFNYKLILDSLNKKNLTAQELAKNMVLTYKETYKDLNNYYTMSAVDLDKIEELTKNINKISVLLSKYLENQKNHRVDKAITFAAFTNKNIRFNEPDYIDIYNFYFNLANYINIMNLNTADTIQIKKALLSGQSLIKSAVIENTSGSKFALVQGLSIYLPTKIHNSYNTLYWATETCWKTFLNTYIRNQKQIR